MSSPQLAFASLLVIQSSTVTTLQYIPILLPTFGHPLHPPLKNRTGRLPQSFGSLLEVWSE